MIFVYVAPNPIKILMNYTGKIPFPVDMRRFERQAISPQLLAQVHHRRARPGGRGDKGKDGEGGEIIED